MLISPIKKRFDDLQQRLREIRKRDGSEAATEEIEITTELEQLREQLDKETSGEPAVLKG